jgi:hypothetical protein
MQNPDSLNPPSGPSEPRPSPSSPLCLIRFLAIFRVKINALLIFEDFHFHASFSQHLLLPEAFVTSPMTTRLSVVKMVVWLKSMRPASRMADVSP